MAAVPKANTVPKANGVVPRWRGEVNPRAEENAKPETEKLDPVRRFMPAWLVSMIIHMTLLLIFALWTMPVGEGLRRVVLEFGEAEASGPSELQVYALESADSLFDEDIADVEVEAPEIVEVESMIESIDLAEPSDVMPTEIGLSAAAVEVPPMFGGRTGAAKAALVAIGGGNDVTMDAVELGLKWLARQQGKKGRWRGSWSLRGPYDDGSFDENRAAATAMAMLAFQGDGNTHFAGEYAKAVEGGVDFLLKIQNRAGFFGEGSEHHQQAYSHAQATIAVCELFAMTQDSRLREPAQRAINYSVQSQGREGGWRYDPRADSDLSITGWYVMALVSAKAAGLTVPHSTLAKIDSYLDIVAVAEVDGFGSSYCYQPGRPPSPAMTAEGLLCRQYLGWPRDREAMAVGMDSLASDWPISRNSMNVYYWYYGTQALHHFGGSAWQIWNGNMKVELPAMQVKRGSEAGSWSPQADKYGNSAGRLYTTCLSIYCLEVYYRHLPLYKKK